MGLPSPDQHGCAHYPRLHRSPRRPPMTIKAGDHLPEVTLQRIRDGVETLDTRTLFDNRKGMIFAVPCAFSDWQSVVEAQEVYVRCEPCSRRIIKKTQRT